MAFGFGFGPAQRRRKGGAVPAPLAPAYLSSAVAPYAAYGAQRIVAGYSGAVYRVRRASDAAEQDVSPLSGGDYPSLAALAAWGFGTTISVTMLYDQSGNARHLTQAIVANQPALDPLTPDGNVAPMVFDGFGRDSGTAPLSHRHKFMSVSGIALDRIAHSILVAGIPQDTQNTSGVSETLSGGSSVIGVGSGGQALGSLTPAPRTCRNVWGFGKNATTNQWRSNGTTIAQADSSTTQAMNKLNIGTSNQSSVTAGAGALKLVSAVVYDSALSVAIGDMVANSLLTAIGAPVSPEYRLVWDGDSIIEGTGSTMMRTTPQLVQAGLTKQFDSFTTAVHGQSLATIYANRVARFSGLFTSARPSVIFVEAGINEIFTDTTGANLSNNIATPLVTYLKGLGYKVVVSTLLPVNGHVGYTAGRETQRTAYNSLVVANSAGADLVLDQASDAIMGPSSAPADTSLYIDNLHPTNAGYARLATLYRGALQTVLRTTVLGTGYVP